MPVWPGDQIAERGREGAIKALLAEARRSANPKCQPAGALFQFVYTSVRATERFRASKPSDLIVGPTGHVGDYGMIARVWHGVVSTEKADAYLRLMQEVALPEYTGTQGNRGAWCLRRDEPVVSHFEMLTFWDDIASIKRFAGENYEKAKYYDFDDTYLVEKEEGVRHSDIYKL